MKGDSPESQSDYAYRLLEEKIVTCEFAPGTFLTEKKICSLLGLGRTPVREALLRLSYEHLLRVVPRQGLKVAPIEYHETIMAIEVRILLERLLTRRTIENSSEFERRQLARFAIAMRKNTESPDEIRYARIDDQLNRFIADTSRHTVAAQHSAPLHTITRRLGYLDSQLRGPERMIKSAGFHADLCDALAVGDVAGAHSSLQDLYDLNIEVLAGLVENIHDVVAE